jgi:hypothetical protein
VNVTSAIPSADLVWKVRWQQTDWRAASQGGSLRCDNSTRLTAA